MQQLNPYLSFDGNCREAMNFYQSCFGGELEMQIVEGSPIAEHMPPEHGQRILHSCLTSGNIVIMASDMIRPNGYHPGNSVSLHMLCSTEAEIDAFYSHLSAGGKAFCPLGPSFFSAKFATVTDKFGVTWVLNYGIKPAW